MTCIFHVVSVVLCAVFTEQTPQHPLSSFTDAIVQLRTAAAAPLLQLLRDGGA